MDPPLPARFRVQESGFRFLGFEVKVLVEG
jgi:hypothetical protein